LQFNTVDQINRHWDVFASQDVQKWVLQKLAFVLSVIGVHDMLRVRLLKKRVVTIPQVAVHPIP